MARERDRIRKWTVLGSEPADRDLVRLMGLACLGWPYVSALVREVRRLIRHRQDPLEFEFVLARHAPPDGYAKGEPLLGSGFRITAEAGVERLTRPHCRCLPPRLPIRKPGLSNGNGSYFGLGYGPSQIPRPRENFDFEDPLHRLTRIHSLFHPGAPITNPVQFLTRLRYKAFRAARFPARQVVRRLTELFEAWLGLDISAWWTKDCRFDREWERTPPWQQRILLPILDAVRHAVDASPRLGHPLTAPGVVLLDRPDLFCPGDVLGAWFELFDRLLPNMQFVVTLSPRARRRLPTRLRQSWLRLPRPRRSDAPTPRKRLPARAVLLVDVDSQLPNVALMKLSRYFKARGQRVHLARKEIYEGTGHEVWASCVFHHPASLGRVEKLRRHYGDALHLGGSGIDLARRLDPHVENLEADYSLYPELGDRAIGFLTRGCPFSCPFCVVPRKEGRVRQVSDLDSLAQGRGKLILLDDNILGHPSAAGFLEEMVRRGIQVNFNQTLDIRLLDAEKGRLLRRIRCRDVLFRRENYFFSLNDTRQLDLVARRYAQLGFGRSDNVEFICMYGFKTTLAEDLERFRFLRSLPGAYVFAQQYQPFPGAPPPELTDFFDSDTDRHLDDLVRIVYRQNMKSMEKYYRWVSHRYALEFGKLHQGLVDTIFRYNRRHAKGRYLATLAGTLPMQSQCAEGTGQPL